MKSLAVRMSNAILRMTLQVQGIHNMHDGHQTNRTPLIQICNQNGSARTGEYKVTSP